jgi:hypothetical protein
MRRAALIIFDQAAAERDDPRCLSVVFDGDKLPTDRDFTVVGFMTWEPNGHKGGKTNATFNKPEQFRVVNLTWNHTLAFVQKVLRRGFMTEEEKENSKVFLFSTEEKEPKKKIRRA